VAIKVKIPRRRPAPAAAAGKGKRGARGFDWRHPAVKISAAAALLTAVVCVAVFAHFYIKYEKIVDRKLRGQLFSNAARIYARPKTVWLGESIGTEDVAAQLRAAGYSDANHRSSESPLGTYRVLPNGIEIQPGPSSYHNQDGAVIRIAGGQIENIVGTGGLQGKPLEAYELEPELITSVDPEARSKRQVVQFKDIPKVLVDAVISIEDRRFFQHSGVNYWRVLQAAWVDLREGGSARQGGSTLTMQMARAFFLTPQKTIKRKLTEMLIAIELEQKLTKEQIFELYANQVDLGQRGSYTINGFAEASRSYFNKDLRDITLPEAALLAGLVQRPSYLSPYRHPERALERRNLVLDTMVETGSITREAAERAKMTPLKLAPPNVEASDAPYFVDLIKDSVLGRYNEHEIADNGYRVYTTLDPDLQKAAAIAVQDGMKNIDEQVQRLRTRRVKAGTGPAARYETKVLPGPQAQVALVAIDPHTGEVLALVGGRNYGMSQLDHAIAKRPTGSVFKPFVYAAAVNTALTGDPMNILTPATLVDDSPGTFTYGDQIYEPRNYKNEYHGLVTARYALAHSLNNATVRMAEQVGYDKVAALARAAGLTSVKPTPAMALGAYDATPVDVAGAYTVFANDGVRVSPVFAKSVRNAQGDLVENFDAQKTTVLDPRVAYVLTSMMEGVINNGTAAGVRAMGFTAPAAGKTGTSHDGWFAGYTTNLLCVVWIGFDDYSDLRLSGATTAAPIWADFMKRALKVPEYADATDFRQPSGVVDVQLDKNTNRIATASCPDTYDVAFIAGTEPTDTCDQQPGDHRGILSRILGIGTPPPPPPVVVGAKTVPAARPATPTRPGNGTVTSAKPPQNPAPEKKKKGFFGKIIGIFKGDDSSEKPASPPPR
jgi:penicillin-binding protein 1B